MGAGLQRDIHRRPGRHRRRGRAHRLEGAGDVQQAAAVDDVGSRIARLAPGAQQDVDGLPSGQVGEGLQQQGQRPRHGGRGEGGAVHPPAALVLAVDNDVDAGRGQEGVLRHAGAVGEGGDLLGLVMRPRDDDGAGETRIAGVAAGPFGVGALLIARGDGEDHARIDRAQQGRLELGAQGALAAERQIDHPRSVLHRIVQGPRQVAALEAHLVFGFGAVADVSPDRQDGRVEGHSDRAVVVEGRGDDAGHTRPVPVLALALVATGDDVRGQGRDVRAQVLMVHADAGIDHAHRDPAPGRAGAPGGDGVGVGHAPVALIFPRRLRRDRRRRRRRGGRWRRWRRWRRRRDDPASGSSSASAAGRQRRRQQAQDADRNRDAAQTMNSHGSSPETH